MKRISCLLVLAACESGPPKDGPHSVTRERADQLAATGELEKAVEIYEQLLQKSPRDAEVLFRAALCWLRLADRPGGRSRLASAYARAAAHADLAPRSVSGQLLLGQVFQRAGVGPLAARHFRKALELAPDDAQARALARDEYEDLGDGFFRPKDRKAVALVRVVEGGGRFRYALQVAAEKGRYALHLTDFHANAKVFAWRSDVGEPGTAEVRRIGDRLETVHSFYVRALEYLASAGLKPEQFLASAATEFERVAAGMPENLAAWRGIMTCRHRLGAPLEALAAARKLLELDGDSAAAWKMRGVVLFESKCFAWANLALEKADAADADVLAAKQWLASNGQDRFSEREPGRGYAFDDPKAVHVFEWVVAENDEYRFTVALTRLPRGLFLERLVPGRPAEALGAYRQVPTYEEFKADALKALEALKKP